MRERTRAAAAVAAAQELTDQPTDLVNRKKEVKSSDTTDSVVVYATTETVSDQ